jgi:hypothetical protein
MFLETTMTIHQATELFCFLICLGCFLEMALEAWLNGRE